MQRIRGGDRPPWAEHIRVLGKVHAGKQGATPPAYVTWINHDRPTSWLEIVARDGRVMLRSRRPLAQIVPVLAPGERVFTARRRDNSRSIHMVTRKLVHPVTP